MYILPCHLQIDTDLDPDPTVAFYLMRIQILASKIKAQTLEKVLK
jgi:hypothetical protein